MNSTNTSITPLVILFENERLQVGGWEYKGVLYKGAPGDGPRVECPTYFSANGTELMLFSKTGAPGHNTHGVYWATGQ